MSLARSFARGFFKLHAVMVGVAESCLGAFAVERGHGPRAQGLLRHDQVGSGVAQVAGALCGGLLLGAPHVGYRVPFWLSALLRALPLLLLFLIVRRDQLPAQLRWIFDRVRTLDELAGPAEANVLRISQVPRAFGNHSTDPPPAL